jgi:hypothetical protein
MGGMRLCAQRFVQRTLSIVISTVRMAVWTRLLCARTRTAPRAGFSLKPEHNPIDTICERCYVVQSSWYRHSLQRLCSFAVMLQAGA